MRKLWSGEFYRFDRLKLAPPLPPSPIPVWVGGISDLALRRAARNEGWLSDLQSTSKSSNASNVFETIAVNSDVAKTSMSWRVPMMWQTSMEFADGRRVGSPIS